MWYRQPAATTPHYVKAINVQRQKKMIRSNDFWYHVVVKAATANLKLNIYADI